MAMDRSPGGGASCIDQAGIRINLATTKVTITLLQLQKVLKQLHMTLLMPLLKSVS